MNAQQTAEMLQMKSCMSANRGVALDEIEAIISFDLSQEDMIAEITKAIRACKDKNLADRVANSAK